MVCPALAFTGPGGRRIVEPGEILLEASSSSLDTPVRDATVLRQRAVPVSVEREQKQRHLHEAAPPSDTVAPLPSCA